MKSMCVMPEYESTERGRMAAEIFLNVQVKMQGAFFIAKNSLKM